MASEPAVGGGPAVQSRTATRLCSDMSATRPAVRLHILAWVAVGACGDGTRVAASVELAADSALVSEVVDGSAGFDTLVLDVAEVAADEIVDDVVPEVGSDGGQSDAASDVAVPADVAIPEVVTCATPSYLEQYPAPFPPFPYGIWPEAQGCLAAAHDVVIVLGCPSEDDGSPAGCQEERAEMADLLYEAGWSERFIVSGAAVHTPWVEAEALAELLVARGIPAEAVVEEPLAEHTDENIYYATRIMEREGWSSAIVVSDDPAHLMYTGLCDASCCVGLGRMTLVGFPVGGLTVVNAGHYALAPPGPGTSAAECAHLEALALCVKRDERRACKDDFQLER